MLQRGRRSNKYKLLGGAEILAVIHEALENKYVVSKVYHTPNIIDRYASAVAKPAVCCGLSHWEKNYLRI